MILVIHAPHFNITPDVRVFAASVRSSACRLIVVFLSTDEDTCSAKDKQYEQHEGSKQTNSNNNSIVNWKN